MKRHIPNLLTCSNLFCGCIGIVECFRGHLAQAANLVALALVFDFLDGFVARLLNTSSAIGKELDSLADVVSFGILPSVMLFHFLEKSKEFFYNVSYLAFLIAIFSALRLAKFNIDTRQTNSFIGLPTPANAILIASFPLIIQQNAAMGSILNDVTFLIPFILLMCYLLVAQLPLFALKFKSYDWAGNQIRYIFIIISVILLAILQYLAIPFIIFLYIFLSLLHKFFKKKPTKTSTL